MFVVQACMPADQDRMLAFEDQHVVASPYIKMAAAISGDLKREEEEFVGDVVVCSPTSSFPDIILQSQRPQLSPPSKATRHYLTLNLGWTSCYRCDAPTPCWVRMLSHGLGNALVATGFDDWHLYNGRGCAGSFQPRGYLNRNTSTTSPLHLQSGTLWK